MAYKLQFGTYVFPNTLRPIGVGGSQHRASSSRPRGSGAITQIARREEGTLEIHGELSAPTPAALETAIDQLAQAIYNGKQQFWHGRDDIYYRDAQVQSFNYDWHDGLLHGALADVHIQLVAADYPEKYSATVTSPTLTTSGGTIAVLGTAPSDPLWTITIGAAGTGDLTLSGATGKTAILSAISGTWSAGDVISLDADSYQILLNSVPTFGLLDLAIPTLDPNVASGNNLITLATAGTATIASITCAYQARYR